MSLLIKHIKQLVQVDDGSLGIRKGEAQGKLPIIEDAWLLMDKGLIIDFGNMSTCPTMASQVVNAKGKFVLPSYVDSHTHLVFAASREGEFEDRINGLTYEEIAAKGGGIINSAKKLADMPEEDLLEMAYHRLMRVKDLGTGAIEIKSGYGLSVDAEVKMLKVIQKLKSISPIPIKATFLGAHAIPTAHKANPQHYIDEIINVMLPKIAAENLADYVDVFCEKNYFSVEQMDTILKAAAKFGLKPKVHVNQFNALGGIANAIENNAVSVDHLEVINDDDIDALKQSNCIATLLPSCSFFINIPYANAKKLIENDVPVALATDYNPGSTPSGNMSFVLSLACLKLNMTPQQAINAATINAAHALNLENELGTIKKGKRANVFITKKMPSLAYLPYSFGENLIETVIINGEIQK